MESSSSPSSSSASDGCTSGTTDEQKPQPLSATAQQAYDRYGVLDPVKLDLMVRGIFITREDAAALPHSITADGCAEVKPGGSHYRRPSIAQSAPRLASVTPTVVARTSPVARVPSVASSSSRNDISATPSDHEKWTEDETELLIKLRAERVGFREVAHRFPSKNQKAVQEKFYKAIKDKREHRWKQLYDDLRARHDKIMNPCASTVEIPIEILDEDTVVQPAGKPSETLRATTMADPNNGSVKNIQNTSGSALEDIENTIEDIKAFI